MIGGLLHPHPRVAATELVLWAIAVWVILTGGAGAV